jgi:succinate dehydrogenase/fumarate reductase flavoprotein subunit
MGPPTVAIIGSGLAGLSAALESSRYAAAAGAPLRIVLLEKMGNAGGNSAKASSGINAINIDGGDSAELFANDTLKSGGSLSKEDLVTRLVVSYTQGSLGVAETTA